jgi:ketosteroid isomerase-like protein
MSPQLSSAHAEVQENNDRFCAALGRRDLDALMAYYDPEICLLIPGAPPIRGHDGVRAYYEQVFAAGVNAASMETVQLEEAGDRLVEIGTYKMALDPPGAEPFEDTRKYMIVHRRQDDGTWAMWLDMFHSDGGA